MHAKLRALQAEQQRLRAEERRAAAEWADACHEAERWLLRAALLAGRRGVAAAVPARGAQVEVSWTVSMGVRHPSGAVVRPGEAEETAAPWSSAAVPEAARAHRTALSAAARHGAAAFAVRRIDAEVLATRRRLRALEERWLPRLRDALHRLEVGLEEEELAEGGRLRWAHGEHPTG
jgi:V/A-type H+-transporting ATPase subunit D